MSRFATISEDRFKKLIEDKDSKSTKQATKVAVSVFRSYLKEKHLEDDFENFPSEQLDDILSKFYLEMRKCCGGVYKTSSFKAIRHGLNRFLPNVDIVNDAKNFPKSTESFKAMSAEIKRQGGGGIDHHPPIESEDLKKLYNYLDVSNPVMLQKKVFIDILIHFGRRGREGLRNLTVSDFVLTTDAEGSRYLYLKKDEATKNHRNDPNTATASMHEVPGQDEKCPVNSFLRYRRMLPIGCVTLWPKPLTKPSKDGEVFSKSSLGHNKLGSLMKELSVEAQLSKVYTNHSLRASSVHVLDSANVPTRHIMAVTGHKAESSLKTYTGYTDQNTKKTDVPHY